MSVGVTKDYKLKVRNLHASHIAIIQLHRNRKKALSLVTSFFSERFILFRERADDELRLPLIVNLPSPRPSPFYSCK